MNGRSSNSSPPLKIHLSYRGCAVESFSYPFRTKNEFNYFGDRVNQKAISDIQQALRRNERSTLYTMATCFSQTAANYRTDYYSIVIVSYRCTETLTQANSPPYLTERLSKDAGNVTGCHGRKKVGISWSTSLQLT